MISTPTKKRILVAEDESDLREIITFYLESAFGVEVMQAEDGDKAKKILESDPDFQIIVSDYNMPIMTGGALFTYVKSMSHPAKFILVSTVNPKEAPEFKTTKPDGYIEKPMFGNELKVVVGKILEEMGSQESPADYVRVSINQLLKIGSFNCPLFAKLSDNKYVKVVNENEVFGVEESERFTAKSIQYLYVVKANAKILYQHLQESYAKHLKDQSITPDGLIGVSDDITSSVQMMASQFGFSEELEQMTKTGVDLALKTIASSPSLKTLLNNLNLQNGNYLAVHSSRLPFLANHIAKLMGWDSEATSMKIAFACMLHDSTLHNPLHPDFRDETALEVGTVMLSKEDFECFHYHPTKAAEIAKQFKGIPPDVDVIIAQHHEKCDGTGFPNKLNHTRIAPLACVFIVAHELLCFYEKTGNQFNIDDFIQQNKENFSAGTFKKIMTELAKFKLG